MQTYRHETVTELLEAYESDLGAEHDEAWWADTEYTVETDPGTVHFQPLQVTVDAGVESKSWRVFAVTDRGSVGRHRTDGHLPGAADASAEIHAVIRQARPSRHPERDRVISHLRELASQRHKIDMEARRVALEAVAHGVKKIAVADAAKISRVTLDKWLRDH